MSTSPLGTSAGASIDVSSAVNVTCGRSVSAAADVVVAAAGERPQREQGEPGAEQPAGGAFGRERFMSWFLAAVDPRPARSARRADPMGDAPSDA